MSWWRPTHKLSGWHVSSRGFFHGVPGVARSAYPHGLQFLVPQQFKRLAALAKLFFFAGSIELTGSSTPIAHMVSTYTCYRSNQTRPSQCQPRLVRVAFSKIPWHQHKHQKQRMHWTTGSSSIWPDGLLQLFCKRRALSTIEASTSHLIYPKVCTYVISMCPSKNSIWCIQAIFTCMMQAAILGTNDLLAVTENCSKTNFIFRRRPFQELCLLTSFIYTTPFFKIRTHAENKRW